MFSAAGASLFLSFLPMLPSQVLLNNLLYDVGQLAIPGDRVDPETVARPAAWDIGFVRRFMLVFGPVSSLFDVLTFALLLGAFAATADTFRTAWFVESLLTELVIALVVRTRRPFHRSRPGRLLLLTTLILIPVTFAIPYLPYADILGFVPLPVPIVLALVAITSGYVGTTELVKARFYRGRKNPPPGPVRRKRFALRPRQAAA
jgi:P-type Mg2+ transporter